MATTGPGYTPRAHMPVIGPPPAGVDPAAHYATVAAAATVQVETVPNHGLRIVVSNPASARLFAMTGGTVTFIPAGNPLPTSGAEPSPGAGSLVLKTWMVDVAHLKTVLPPGVPPMTSVLYLDVKPDTVRASLEPLVRALPEPALRAVWVGPASPANRTEMEDQYLDRLLLGATELFVDGGTPLGEPGPRDPADPAAGSAFVLRLADGARADLSPILHLRGMPNYAGAAWVGHPLVTALSAIPVPVDIYLQFEVWNETTKAFETLPADVPIDLMEADPLADDVLDTQNTDALGRVHFSIPDLTTAAGEAADLYFRARPSGLQHAGQTLPGAWSTRGWRAADGSPGYYPSFVGTQLGSAASPLIFRIGLDFHGRLTYRNWRTAANVPAPPGVLVEFHGDRLWGPRRLFRTDAAGEIHGVIFDLAAGGDVGLYVAFNVEDSAINLPVATAYPDDLGWFTWWNDADQKYYPNNDATSIGTQIAPEIFRCTIKDRHVSLYFLKIVRELSVFLFHMTGGAWTGVDHLNILRQSPSGVAFSWPVGKVCIPPVDHWRRGTLIHEISHQLMWKEVNFSSLGIAYEGILGDLHLYHVSNLLANPEHALIEGWAEFMQAVFAGTRTPPYSVGTLVDSAGATQPIGPPPNNRGESVEGAFADGLWGVFENHVVTPAVSANAHVPESVNGDVAATAPWILDAAVQQRFLSMIWEPLRDLKPLTDPTTTDMLHYLHTRSVAVWHRLRPELQAFNMAMAPPTAVSISPPSGPRAGGTTVTIVGTHFVVGIQVRIGGAPASNIVVSSSTLLTAETPPGAPGAAPVDVRTPAGSGQLASGYLYQ